MSNLPYRPNVCMLLFNKDVGLFLGERANEAGIWQFPQGGVEPGSSLEESVLRELYEEAGIDRSKLQIVKKLSATHEYDFAVIPDYARGVWRGQSQTFWLVRFLGEDTDIDLRLHEPEFMNWRWCQLGELEKWVEPRRFNGYRKVLDEVINYFGAAI